VAHTLPGVTGHGNTGQAAAGGVPGGPVGETRTGQGGPGTAVDGRYAAPMHSPRTTTLAASALVTVGLLATAGCSGSSSTPTTTTTPKVTTTTAPNPLDLPATGSVDGVTLTVTSSPLTGVAGSTTMHVKAQLSGTVTAAHLVFEISSAASAESGRAATTQTLSVAHPGSFDLPTAFRPPKAGNWAVTVTYAPTSAKDSKLSVSGLPPRVGLPAPFPQLVTVVTAG